MTMAALNTQPGTSTPKQRQRLHQLKRRLRWSDDDLHAAIGVDSTTKLSAAQASELIRQLGGGKLPHPPGQKPAPFEGKRKRTTAIRAIQPDHEEQIMRLLGERFEDEAAGLAWLRKNFKADRPRDLLTARRAAQVIHVLKTMLDRDGGTDGPPVWSSASSGEDSSPAEAD